MDISPDLKVTQPTVTLISNTFIKIENYEEKFMNKDERKTYVDVKKGR